MHRLSGYLSEKAAWKASKPIAQGIALGYGPIAPSGRAQLNLRKLNKDLQSGNILLAHYKCFYVAIQIIGQYLLFINFLLSISNYSAIAI